MLHTRADDMGNTRAWSPAPVVACLVALLAAGTAAPAGAAETLNAYSIWPENWARPMLQEFEKATGIKVNFLRFSSGEALARVITEKSNPRVDVLFGGPVETFAAGIKEGIFEPYKPPSFNALPARFKQAEGYWVAIADDPLVFIRSMTAISATIFLVSINWTLITVRILENITELSLGPAAAFSVLVIAIVFVVIGGIGWALRRLRSAGGVAMTGVLGG